MCECFEGFRFDHSHGYCVGKKIKFEFKSMFRINLNCPNKDINECEKLEKDLGMGDLCQKDSTHMQTCTNLCGNYTCECRDTPTTTVDIYDPTRCYSSSLK